MEKYRLTFLIAMVMFALNGSCSVLINPTQEINVRQDSTIIESGNGEYNFGRILVNEVSQSVIFTIENTGNTTLILDESPDTIEITGDTESFNFDVSSVKTIIDPENNTTFTVSFSPKSDGVKSVIVSIASNDIDENPYTFKITGEGVIPDINVKQNTTSIPTITGLYDMGNVLIGTSSVETEFTIENIGFGTLELFGNPKLITIIGSDYEMFSVKQSLTDHTVLPGNSTTFSITFIPTSEGSKSITVSIKNSDKDENPYTFTVTGSGFIAPEINIQDSASNDILCNSGMFDFGSVLINGAINETFTIQNLGNTDLILSGNSYVEINGADAYAFDIVAQPYNHIFPGSSSTFNVRFQPDSNREFYATIRIENNDLDENPYTFTVKGKGVQSEINIIDSDSNTIPNGTGTFDFGNIRVNLTKDETFTIQNLGNGNLFLTGNPLIVFTGLGASDFAITSQPANLIAPSSDTTFKIEFTPTLEMQYSITVSIANNDLDENPYTFTIMGYARISQFDYNGDGFDDYLVGARADSEGGESAGAAFLYFGSQILSSQYQYSDADVKFVGEDSQDIFGWYVSVIGDFNGDGYDDILVSGRGDDDGGNNAGAVYIFYGEENPDSKIDASKANVKLIGADSGDAFGAIISPAGDFNNDGYDDVVVGAFYDDDGGTDSGCAFIFFGSFNPSAKIDASNANVKLVGEDPNDMFGWGVSDAGDFNNDGYDDVVVGAFGDDDGGNQAGCAFVFFGSNNSSSSVDASNADVKIIGTATRDFSRCSYAGDFNKDGLDDFMVSGRNEVCIFFGNKNPSKLIYSNQADVTLYSEPYYQMGWAKSFVDDINNDGIDDIIIGCEEYDLNGGPGQSAGCLYIFYGDNNPPSVRYAVNADVKIIGVEGGDYFGVSASSLGDFNKDGIKDFIVGASGTNNGYMNGGTAYIFFGNPNMNPSLTASNADIKILGAGLTRLGSAVAGGR